MRKHILLSILIFIVFFVFVVISNAADLENVILKSSKDKVTPGETFTITVSAKSENGLNGIEATMEYDKNVLEVKESKLVDVANWAEYDNFPKIVAMWKNSTEDTNASDIYEITFNVKDEVTVDTTDIKLTGVTLSVNKINEDIKIDNLSKTITIQNDVDNNDNNITDNNTIIDNTNNVVDNNTISNDTNNIIDENTISNDTNNIINDNTISNNKVSDDNTVININNNTTGTVTKNNKNVENKANLNTSKNKLPYTGNEKTIVIISIILIAIIGIVSYVSYKKYQNI